MNYLYSFLALDLANQRREDVFSMEYRQTQEADQARHAAELSASGAESTLVRSACARAGPRRGEPRQCRCGPSSR